MVLIIHHLLFFILFFVLVVTIIKSFMIWRLDKKGDLNKTKLPTLAILLAHIQMILGIILIFNIISNDLDWVNIMQNAVSRQTIVEHPITMLFAIIALSFGRIRSKKVLDNKRSAKIIFYSFLTAIFLILIRLPYDKLFIF